MDYDAYDRYLLQLSADDGCPLIAPRETDEDDPDEVS